MTSPSGEPAQPDRVLVVSAAMGAGHDAAGRALAAAVTRLWPDATVQWVDVLDAVGLGTAPLFRGIYAGSVQHWPWAYEYFYGSLWRRRWFARAAKRFMGMWTGRRLLPVLARCRPDLVVSTFPMASTGLEWLRRHRDLSVRTGAWICDFAPHPSWVHADVDLNLVLHEVAVRPARDAVPGAVVAVTAPPVAQSFRPASRTEARRGLDMPDTALLAVVSCGSLGFGPVGDTVQELLDGHPRWQVVVVSGHNDRQHAELGVRFDCVRRVRVLGWVENMAELMAAADLVVTNAGGATVLEALACGRAVVLHNPIAGHGRANAALLAEAGLVRVCSGPGELTALVGELAEDRRGLRELEAAAQRYTNSRDLEAGLVALSTAGFEFSADGYGGAEAGALPSAVLDSESA
ncbi:MAG TPA: glycosyltransferase [Pseudonocardiaceae bacterium]|nr:glycosyltransferase [Pseudonocardiaceae bacterium]